MKNISDLIPIVSSYLTKNREHLKKYNECICIHCGEKFRFMDITDWIDGDKTALCPKCSLDTVVPIQVHTRTNEFVMSDKLLEEIKKLYGG